jgi:hypothetical protein
MVFAARAAESAAAQPEERRASVRLVVNSDIREQDALVQSDPQTTQREVTRPRDRAPTVDSGVGHGGAHADEAATLADVLAFTRLV